MFSAKNTFPTPPLLHFQRMAFALNNCPFFTFINDKSGMAAGNKSVGHSTRLWCYLLPDLSSYHSIFISEIPNAWKKKLSYLPLLVRHLSVTAFQLLSWCLSPPLFPICSSSALV